MPEPFRFANNQVYSVEHLFELCQQFPDEAINYLIREDFEKWLAYIGRTDFATYAAQARQASVSNEEKLHKFIESCQEIKTSAAKKQSESTSLPNKIILAIKSLLLGNRQKTQEQKLSTE